MENNNISEIQIREEINKIIKTKNLSQFILCVSDPVKLSEDVVTKDFVDLKLYVRLIIKIDNTIGSVTITKDLMKHLGLSIDELFEIAKRNTYGKRILKNMAEMLMSLEFDLDLDTNDDLYSVIGNEKYFVLTIDEIIYGAGLIATKAIAEFAKQRNCDICILPSSIHEIILLPVDQTFDFSVMKMTVTNANINFIDDKDKLSDNVYIYKLKDNTIEIYEN